jgi:hypothetical protein
VSRHLLDNDIAFLENADGRIAWSDLTRISRYTSERPPPSLVVTFENKDLLSHISPIFVKLGHHALMCSMCDRHEKMFLVNKLVGEGKRRADTYGVGPSIHLQYLFLKVDFPDDPSSAYPVSSYYFDSISGSDIITLLSRIPESI